MKRFRANVAYILSVAGIAIACLLSAVPAIAEWYAGGYGGVSLNGKISDGDMPFFANNTQTLTFPPGYTPNPGRGDFRSQAFSLTGDVNLKNSPMFGARVGYFFNQFGFPWAGLELEAFSTGPTLKSQTVPYTQNITLSCQQTPPCPVVPNGIQSTSVKSTAAFGQADFRVSTLALNAVVRYPGKIFQPYAGVGVGLFYFQVNNLRVQDCKTTSPCPGGAPLSTNGRDLQPGLNAFGGLKVFVTDSIAVFGEFKYNSATIQQLENIYGLGGNYSIQHLLGGIAYHFN